MKSNTLRNTIALLTFLVLALGACRRAPERKLAEDHVEDNYVKDGYVEVTGGKIWYRMIGSGKQTPLITMHGGPGGTHRSFYLLETISEDRPIVMFDQLGSGKSGSHKDTTLLKVENFVEQVQRLREALDLDEVYFLGSSWGTALALESYLAHPEGVKGIIFNSPYFSTPIWEADADTLITYLPDSIQKAIEIGEKENDFNSEAYQQANKVFLKNYGRRNDRVSTPWDTVKAPRSDFIYNYMWGPTEFTARGTLKTYDRFENLKQVEVPTLFITGEFDEARAQTVKRFQALIKGSEFAIIKGAGHSTLNDNREQNVKVIREFLNRLDQRD